MKEADLKWVVIKLASGPLEVIQVRHILDYGDLSVTVAGPFDTRKEARTARRTYRATQKGQAMSAWEKLL